MLPVATCAQDHSAIVHELLTRKDRTSAERVFRVRRSLGPDLVAALKDPEPMIRRRAAEALRTMDYAPAASALVAAGKDPDWGVSKAAVLTLVHLSRPRYTMMHGETGEVTVSPAKIAMIGPRAVPILLEFLTTGPRTNADRSALVALYFLRDERCIEPLIGYIDRSGGWEMSAAMDVLGLFDDPRVIPTLVRNIAKGVPDYGGTPGIWVLKRLKEKAREPLELAMRSSPVPAIRFQCAQALCELAFPESKPALLAAAKDSYPYVRRVIARGLSKFPGPESVVLLKTLLSDRSPTVVQAAIYSVDDLKATGAIEPLIGLLHHPMDWIRQEAWPTAARLDPRRMLPLALAATFTRENRHNAIVALRHIPDSRARKRLVQFLEDAEPENVSASAGSLGINPAPELKSELLGAWERQKGSETIVPALIAIAPEIVEEAIRALKDQNRTAAAIKILGASKSEAAATALLAYVDTNLSASACEALVKLGDRRVIPLLLPHLKRSSPLLGVALSTLGKLKATEAVEPILALFRETWSSELGEALCSLGDARAADVFIAHAENSRLGDSRWKALRMMGSFRTAKVYEYLIGKLGSTEAVIVDGAAEGLSDFGDIRALPALHRAMDDPEIPAGHGVAEAIRLLERKAEYLRRKPGTSNSGDRVPGFGYRG